MQGQLPLAVAVITLNEERNLARCLASVRDLATEIVIIDSGSTDQTAAIARQFPASFSFNQWAGHVAQKNVALRRCTQPWVLCLDADEELSPELAAALRQLFAAGAPAADGYLISRRTWYLGAWIWHAWYPEWRLRLVRRDKAEWQGLDPHDQLTVTGQTQRLTGDLLHYSFQNLQDHLMRTITYARLMAESQARTGRQFCWSRLVFAPWYAFFKRLVLKQGWRDGWRGWIIAFASLLSSFAKAAFLFERQRTGPAQPGNSATA